MGFELSREGLDRVLTELGESYLLYAPVLKVGEGRFTDTDVVRYDYVSSVEQIELAHKSDYAFKELLTPLSETLFFFTENECKVADAEARKVIVFLRACDLHAVKRLDQMYLANGPQEDWFYRRVRDRVAFALIGCPESFDNCFCCSMDTNVAPEGWLFSLEQTDDGYRCVVADEQLTEVFAAQAVGEAAFEPAHVSANDTVVRVPESVPVAIYQHSMWDEYTARCIKCGRCTISCPTCTCYTMQDVFYTDNGRVGERRRVGASCMIDGYTNVAGGGQYRRTACERIRFKVLHKVHDFRKRFGYDMCVGCGRCDDICPEYISFAACVNKLADAVDALAAQEVSADE
jgi:anaerobic sulfite reductase subunit A